MKKGIAGVVFIVIFISAGYLVALSQTRQPAQVSISKSAQIEPVDLLNRVQKLEKEIAELKRVIRVNGPSVRIESDTLMTIQAPQLELKGMTTVQQLDGGIRFNNKILQGTCPHGPVTIPLPDKLPISISK